MSISIVDMPSYAGGKHLPGVHGINLVVQGKMRFRCGDETKTARAGELVYTPPGVTLQRTGLGPMVWLYIDLEDIPMWAPLKEIGFYVRKYESADMMYILTHRITNALRSQDVYSMDVARESSQILISLIKREFRQSLNAWSSKRMDDFVKVLDRIRARPDLKWDRATIAQDLKMSERTLVREFKRIFNMPPSKMVSNIRMDIAARLMINTDRSLTDIASFVGYESPFSFSRLFKKHVGVSPDRYRTMPAAERQKPHLALH